MRENVFFNPILAGDFPDPSIVRVENDYYMVNSTFQYFPGIIISHSRDLIHWQTIGHVLTRKKQLDLSKIQDSAGIWAPDISYYDNRFWVAYTLQTPRAGQNCLVSSEKPEGPYSDPVVLHDTGIDPSIFTDDDGSRYFIASSGSQKKRFMYKLAADGRSLIGSETLLWPGTGLRCPEGPHIFKHNGYYYIILAEGGTGYGHCETCARSRRIEGPYKPSPLNPVLQPVSLEHPIQKTGHGKPVQTQNGEWWFVFLGSRPVGGKYCNLGRETFLSKISWTSDRWFYVNPPSLKNLCPDLPEHIFTTKKGNEFTSGPAMLAWESVRNPAPGAVRMDTKKGTVKLSNAIFTKRLQHFDVTAYASAVYKNPGKRETGLILYTDTINHIQLCRLGSDWMVAVTRNGEKENFVCHGAESDVSYFKIKITGQDYMLEASNNNKNWQQIGPVLDGRFMAPESIAVNRKCFTGVRIGIVDRGCSKGHTLFSFFEYQGTDP